MTKIRLLKNAAVIAASVSILAGCATNAVTHSFTVAVQPPSGFSQVMLTNVIYAVVMSDEDSITKLGRVDRNVAYDQGIRYDSADEHLRLVRVNMLNFNYPILKWVTLAAVPDTFPLLKDGDVVAIRMPTNLDGLLNFSDTKEGTSAVSVVCLVDRKDYTDCWKNVPVPDPKNRMKGANGVAPIPFRASLRDYGFTYSPRYDAAGHVLVEAPAPAQRNAYPLMSERF